MNSRILVYTHDYKLVNQNSNLLFSHWINIPRFKRRSSSAQWRTQDLILVGAEFNGEKYF